jgi:hypothetical protein
MSPTAFRTVLAADDLPSHHLSVGHSPSFDVKHTNNGVVPQPQVQQQLFI